MRPLCFLVLLLSLAAAPCVAYRSMGPYELMLLADYSDYLVVGEVVGTEDFDSGKSARVSLVRVQNVLFGDVAAGDTLSVHWRTAQESLGDGYMRITTEPGPQLSRAVGPHVWLVLDVNGELRSGGDPIRLSPASRSGIAKHLEWAEAPRRPYAGTISDPEKAREHGLDPQTGDVIRQLLAAYLAGYLAALGDYE